MHRVEDQLHGDEYDSHLIHHYELTSVWIRGMHHAVIIGIRSLARGVVNVRWDEL